jgi:uncharacterized protein (DUF362 family)
MTMQVTRRSVLGTMAGMAQAFAANQKAPAAPGRSPVGLIQGEDRAKNITAALAQLDKDVLPRLKAKKKVVIKPNFVSTNKQLAATHVDAIRGIMEWLAPRWKGEVVVAESSAGDTLQAFDNFGFAPLVSEYKRHNLKLVDLNDEGLYETIHLLNADLHIQPVRLAARLLDPEAFVISSCMLKTHNTVIATLNVKNMTLGAPLHQKKGEAKRWNDKRVYHGGVRQTHYDIMRTAERMRPSWGLGVIDGFEGMEGNGPSQGTPIASRIAIVSPDMIACDRIGVEAMGIDPGWMGYLQWCEQVGVGAFSRDRIEVRGETVEKVARKYRMHGDIERELQWMGPLTELPPKLG